MRTSFAKLIALMILVSALYNYKFLLSVREAGALPYYLGFLLIMSGPLAWLVSIIGAFQIITGYQSGAWLILFSALLLTISAYLFGVFCYIPFLHLFLDMNNVSPVETAMINLGTVAVLFFLIQPNLSKY